MEAKEKEKMDAKMAFEEEREKRVGTQKKTSSFPTIKSGRGDDFDFRDIPSKRGDDYDVDDDYGGMDYDGGAGFDDNENDDFDGGRTPGPEAEYVSAENRPQLDEEEEERSDDVWARYPTF
jgi:hypothetical protein